MELLKQRDLTEGQVVLTKYGEGYIPQFFVNWQHHPKSGIGPVCERSLSYLNHGNHAVYENGCYHSNKLKLFTEGILEPGNIIIVYQGGYNNIYDESRLNYPISNSDSNWILAFYCGIMNGKIIAAQIYNPKTNNFTCIKAYPAMGKIYTVRLLKTKKEP